MTNFPNLTGQDDVYGLSRSADDDNANLSSATIQVILDDYPTALARVFGLLTMFSLTPEHCDIRRANGESFTVTFLFDDVRKDRIDLLRRKLLQLCETVEVIVL